jgi:hypothetical protein
LFEGIQPQLPSLAQNVQHACVVEQAELSGMHWPPLLPLPLPLPMLQNVALHCDAHVPQSHPVHAFHSSIASCDAPSPQFWMHAALMFEHLLIQVLSFWQPESAEQIRPFAAHSFEVELARHV